MKIMMNGLNYHHVAPQWGTQFWGNLRLSQAQTRFLNKRIQVLPGTFPNGTAPQNVVRANAGLNLKNTLLILYYSIYHSLKILKVTLIFQNFFTFLTYPLPPQENFPWYATN